MGIKLRETIPVQEAMDNLASIASIDLNAPGPIGIVKKSRIVIDPNEFPEPQVQWLSGEGSEAILDVLDDTFRSLHQHLKNLTGTANEKQIRGIAAMMALASECAVRIEKYLYSRTGKKVGNIADRAEYQALQHYFEQHFAKKVAQDEPHFVTENPLADLDSVRRDQDYELFYIRREDGTPFFNRDLIRHVQLNCDFDSASETFEEDPLLKVRAMIDRDLQASAGQILADCKAGLTDLFKAMKKLADNELASSLTLATMALFLAANPRNLLHNTTGKTSLQYFEDFHRFLRRAMKTSEYQKWIAYPPEKSERHAQMLLYLTHSLCDSFFHRLGGVKQESIGLIHRTMRRGAEKTKGGSQKGNSLWTQFLFEDETFRSLLAKFPSGPLFKTLDLIREESEEDQLIPFDPVAQHNFPFKLYQIEQKGQLTSLLHIPSPTRQSLIQKAEIIDEFRGTLRSYQMAKPSRRHLMINLQDRTGWKESARAHALEGLQKNAEFSSVFASFTLPKATPFYYQSHGYENMNQASAFLDAFHGVLDRAESNGFSLPTSFKQTELTRFADTALPFIHKYFFDQKNTLTRRQREDFIEIFYHLLTLKLIDKLEPDSVSFTCKDGMDIGAACEASLFAFIKLLTGGMEEKSEQDYFRWVLYTPALFNRERAIDPERFNRMLAALEQIDSALIDNRKQIVQGINELFGPQFLKSLKLTH